MKKTKKAFREHLNTLYADSKKHEHLRFHQRTRGYGDYLYFQDREKFNVEYAEWLLFDLVRFMRSELHQAELITDEEYSWLCHGSDMATSPKGGSPSRQRLEDYDELRAELTHLRAESLRLASANDALQKERDGLRDTKDMLWGQLQESRKQATAAQAAEARLRGEVYTLRKTLGNIQKMNCTAEVLNPSLTMFATEQAASTALSAPPTAALPDGEDVAWVITQLRYYQSQWVNDAQKQDSSHYGDGFKDSAQRACRDIACLISEIDTIRAAITGATK